MYRCEIDILLAISDCGSAVALNYPLHKAAFVHPPKTAKLCTRRLSPSTRFRLLIEMNSDKRKSSPQVRISLKATSTPSSPTSPSNSFAFAFQIRKPAAIASARPSARVAPASARLSPAGSARKSVVEVRPSPFKAKKDSSPPQHKDLTARLIEEAKSRLRTDSKQGKKPTSQSPQPTAEKPKERPISHQRQGGNSPPAEKAEKAEPARDASLARLLSNLAREEDKLVHAIDSSKDHKRNSSADTTPEASSPLNLSDEKTVRRNLLPRANSLSDLLSLQLPKPETGEDKERLKEMVRIAYRAKGEPPATSSDFYRYGKLLGRGAFGKVSLAVHRLTGLNVAIKSIEKSYMKDERARKKVFQEVFTMRRVRHPNVTRLFEVFESTRHFNMVLEYSGGGDLLQLVKSRTKLTEPEAAAIFSQILSGLMACHSRQIIHRDVKLDNVLISAGYTTVKLCDFGVSRMVKEGQRINDQCGTPAYIAPEIIADRGYEGFPVDVWSLGVLLYAMLTGTVPFRAKTMPELQKLILRGKFEIPACLSEPVTDLIIGMLTLLPSQRLTLEEVARHPWVSGFHEDQEIFDSTVPRFLGRVQEDCPASAEQRANEEVLRYMEDLGFPRHSVTAALLNKEINHATATYELLEAALSAHA